MYYLYVLCNEHFPQQQHSRFKRLLKGYLTREEAELALQGLLKLPSRPATEVSCAAYRIKKQVSDKPLDFIVEQRPYLH